jgi:hypothetical protein
VPTLTGCFVHGNYLLYVTEETTCFAINTERTTGYQLERKKTGPLVHTIKKKSVPGALKIYI